MSKTGGIDFNQYIKADAKRYIEHREFIVGGKALIINAICVKNHRLAWQFWFRLIQSKPNVVIWLFAKFMFRRISTKYGIQIPASTQIGKGLYIGHGIGIVIHGKARIGENCNISHFLTIGSNHDNPATIGNNVYIGPGVSIVENVSIGNNVRIGAGTVVVRDIPDNSTSVGNPNRIIQK